MTPEEIFKAASEEGINKATVKRAKQKLGLVSRKERNTGQPVPFRGNGSTPLGDFDPRRTDRSRRVTSLGVWSRGECRSRFARCADGQRLVSLCTAQPTAPMHRTHRATHSSIGSPDVGSAPGGRNSQW